MKSPSGKEFPEIVEGVTYSYVPLSNPFMRAAYDYAKALYEIKGWNKMTSPAAALVVHNKVVAIANAGSEWHQRHGTCRRAELGLPAGVGYDQCEGCHPDNHSERSVIRRAHGLGVDTRGASVYMYGHWWMCRTCLEALIAAGVTEFYMLENADVLFDRNNPGNVIGTPEQFMY